MKLNLNDINAIISQGQEALESNDIPSAIEHIEHAVSCIIEYRSEVEDENLFPLFSPGAQLEIKNFLVTQAELHERIGYFYYLLNNNDEAEKNYLLALSEAEERSCSELEERLIGNLGGLYLEMR